MKSLTQFALASAVGLFSLSAQAQTCTQALAWSFECPDLGNGLSQTFFGDANTQTGGWAGGGSGVTIVDPGTGVMDQFTNVAANDSIRYTFYSQASGLDYAGSLYYRPIAGTNTDPLSVLNHVAGTPVSVFASSSAPEGDGFLLSFSFTSGADYTQLRLNGGTGGTRFDSLTVTAVPEPETYAMMLAGLGALGFMGRRRKLQAV